MKWAALLMVFLLARSALAADEEPAPDPIAELPASLRPGSTARFDQRPLDGRLAGTVRFLVEPGDEKGQVLLVREYATGDLGPLTFKDRLVAVLDAGSRRVLSFRYEIGGKAADPLTLATRLGPDPDREGGLLFESFTYPKQGEPRIKRVRLKPAGPWAPAPLEPFLATLLEDGGELTLIDVAKGRLSRKPVEYALLGKGEMELDGKKFSCRIFWRTRGEEKVLVYLRAADGMPVKHEPRKLALRVEEPK